MQYDVNTDTTTGSTSTDKKRKSTIGKLTNMCFTYSIYTRHLISDHDQNNDDQSRGCVLIEIFRLD